jgi:hypothetical protein
MRIQGEDVFETANLDDFAAQAMHILRLARAAIMHPCTPSVAPDAPTANFGDRLLAAGRIVSTVTILCSSSGGVN